MGDKVKKYMIAYTGREIEDLTDERFEKLLVIKYDEEMHRKTGKPNWVCKCDCGNFRSFQSSQLTRQKRISCCYCDKDLSKCFLTYTGNYTEDLTNRRFVKLVALEYSEEQHRLKKRVMWKCKCDCGNILYVEGYSLLNGNTKSCGCMIRDTFSEKRAALIGTEFGKLVVLGLANEKTKDGKYLYECKCECGSIIHTQAYLLTNGDITSCGCLNGTRFEKEITTFTGHISEDLTDRRFGKLTALRYNVKEHKRTKIIMWDCKCDCGNYKTVRYYDLLNGSTQSCGCLIKESVDNRRKDLTGVRSGKLVALRRDISFETGMTRWICKCDCGNETSVVGTALTRKTTQSCGCITYSTLQESIEEYLKTLGYPLYHENNCSILLPNPRLSNGTMTSALRFDNEIVIEDNHIMIEVQGQQHFSYKSFRQLTRGKPLEEFYYALERDELKRKLVNSLDNYYYIEIPYWFFDKEDSYKKILQDSINNILNGTYVRADYRSHIDTAFDFEKVKTPSHVKTIPTGSGGQTEDITGRPFGKLTILEFAFNRANKVYWRCKCECGNIVIFEGHRIKNGIVTSCNNCDKKLIPDTFTEDLRGIQFTRLTAFEYDLETSKERQASYWKCKCECGKVVIVNSKELKNKGTKSCGCYSLDKVKERRIDLRGRRFGKLLVIEVDEEKTAEMKIVYWKCQCDCGNTKSIIGRSLTGKKTKSCGCLRITSNKTRNKKDK